MARTRTHLEGPPEQVAAVLRERIYGGIACLSTLLVLVRPEADTTASSATPSRVVGEQAAGPTQRRRV